jgi:lipopolysaccharide export system permease protein
VRITSRYVLREHLGPLVFSLSALTSLLLLNYIARKFGDLAGKGIPARVIAEFFLLSVPFTVAMTLPMAVLVATLYAFSRLASENEITAFKASGVSMGRLLAPAIWASAALALVMVFFNDQVLPRANHRLSVLQGDVARARPTFALRPRVINQVGEREFFLQANHVDPATNSMRQVTIYDLTQSTPRTVRADSGTLALAPNRKDLLLTLFDGAVEQVSQGKNEQLSRIHYTRDVVRVRDVAKGFDPTAAGTQTYKGDREMSICELDAAFARAAAERESAERELRAALGDSGALRAARAEQARVARVMADRHTTDAVAAEAARGEAAARDSAAAARAPGIGRLYCLASTRVAAIARAVLPAALPREARAQGLKSAVPKKVDSAAQAAAEREARAGMVSGTVQLARLRLEQAAGEANGYDVEIHKKFALAAACVVFVLLGAPLALRFPRGGVGMVLGVSVGVFALYYSFLIAGQELAQRGAVPPWLSMWGANLLFGGVGLFFARRMGTESGSARGGGVREWVDQWRWRREQRRARRAAAGTPAPAGQAAAGQGAR